MNNPDFSPLPPPPRQWVNWSALAWLACMIVSTLVGAFLRCTAHH